MKLILEDGMEVSLGFRHTYSQQVYSYRHEGELYCNTVKQPVFTEVFLKRFDPATDEAVVVARAAVMKYRWDPANKEMARQYALEALCKKLSKENAQRVMDRYDNRFFTPIKTAIEKIV